MECVRGRVTLLSVSVPPNFNAEPQHCALEVWEALSLCLPLCRSCPHPAHHEEEKQIFHPSREQGSDQWFNHSIAVFSAETELDSLWENRLSGLASGLSGLVGEG